MLQHLQLVHFTWCEARKVVTGYRWTSSQAPSLLKAGPPGCFRYGHEKLIDPGRHKRTVRTSEPAQKAPVASSTSAGAAIAQLALLGKVLKAERDCEEADCACNLAAGVVALPAHCCPSQQGPNVSPRSVQGNLNFCLVFFV